jgi:Mor family transcriptional regulator
MALTVDDLREEQKQIAETVGMEAYMKLTKVFGGTTIYIAKAEEIVKRIDRDRQIREEFDGSNYAQLAVKYGLTEVWIRNIVYEKAVEIRQRPIDGQMNLMDFLEKE